MTEADRSLQTESPARGRPDPMVEGPPPRPSRPRSARLVVRRLEPLSVLRFSLGLAVAGVVIAIVMVAALYELLAAMGVFSSVGSFTHDIGATSSNHVIGLGTVLGWTAIVTAGIAVFCAAAITVATFVYNLINDVVGGPEITLTEMPRS